MVLTSLVLTVGAGCSTTTTEGNQSLTEGNVTKITKGVTTRAEIEDILGQPDEVTLLPDGCRTMTYQGSETKFDWLSVVVQGLMPFYVPMKDPNTTRRQVLQIILDRNNVVEDYEFENGGTETTQTASAFGTHSETKSGVADPTTQGSPN
jgi:hypothetical protein